MNNFEQIQNKKMESTKSSESSLDVPSMQSTQDTSNTLETTTSPETTPTTSQLVPFYLMGEPPGRAKLTGADNLIEAYGMQQTLTKFQDKKVKESLASFLPNIPEVDGNKVKLENSTLRSIIQNTPVCSKQLWPLTASQMSGFRLHSGSLPEEYLGLYMSAAPKDKKSHHKQQQPDAVLPKTTSFMDSASQKTYEKQLKKRHEGDKERKKEMKRQKTADIAPAWSTFKVRSAAVGDAMFGGAMSPSKMELQKQLFSTPAKQQKHRMKQSNPTLGDAVAPGGTAANMNNAMSPKRGGGVGSGGWLFKS